MAIKTPGPGIYRDIPPEEYHRWRAASNSSLTHLMRSPAHMAAYRFEYKETAAQVFGRAVHAAVLEPERFDTDYIKIPGDLNRRTKEGREWRDELLTTHEIMTAEDFDKCIRIREAVHASEKSRNLIAGAGDAELSLVWKDSKTGVKCKARWDRHTPDMDGGAIVDLKTTGDASIRSFERSIYQYGYHRQAAMYLMCAKALDLPVEHYCIIAVEKDPPYGVQPYRITEGTVEAGEDLIRALLKKYSACMKAKEFPGYPDKVRDITVPDYAWFQIDMQITEIEAWEYPATPPKLMEDE